jgi:hypothetical protein
VPKKTGIPCHLYVSGYDLGADIREFNTRSPLSLHDATDITQSAMERLAGLRDGGMAVTAFFNPAANRAHARFKTLPAGDQLATVTIGTEAIGTHVLQTWSKQLNYDGTRDAAGMLTFASDFTSNAFGLECANLLTAGIRTDTGATNGASYDQGSASPGAFGAQFHLHVLSFTGTDATIKVQESSDDGAGDAWADVVGGAFTAVTAGPTFQRIATAAINVERYLRVVTTTSGGFSSMAFLVTGWRNPVLQDF